MARKVDPELIADFQRRFRLAESANAENQKTFDHDRRFVYHDDAQWESDAVGARGDRPRVTINRLQVFARNITDEVNLKGGIDFDNNTGFVNEPRVIGISLSAKR